MCQPPLEPTTQGRKQKRDHSTGMKVPAFQSQLFHSRWCPSRVGQRSKGKNKTFWDEVKRGVGKAETEHCCFAGKSWILACKNYEHSKEASNCQPFTEILWESPAKLVPWACLYQEESKFYRLKVISSYLQFTFSWFSFWVTLYTNHRPHV